MLDGQVKLFAAMLHEEKVIIAQHRIPDETTETTQVRALLDAVDLDNAVVTADAVHHQRQERLRARSPLPRPGDLIRRRGDIGVACPGSSPGGMVLAPRARQAFLECFAGPAA